MAASLLLVLTPHYPTIPIVVILVLLLLLHLIFSSLLIHLVPSSSCSLYFSVFSSPSALSHPPRTPPLLLSIPPRFPLPPPHPTLLVLLHFSLFLLLIPSYS